MNFRSTVIAALLAPVILGMPGTADASSVCQRLNARLANLPQVTTSNASLRDYTGAISRQNLDLRRAKSDLRRLGCSNGSIVVVGGPNDAECGGLEDMIAQMERDLDTLKARRQYMVSGGEDDVMRRRILASLRVNDCAEDENAVIDASIAEPEVHRNILKDLPPIGGGMQLRGSTGDDDFTLPGTGAGTGTEDGALRTMCVRTCDGAFFPISSNATPADFPRDAQACQRRCPGTETALYYHTLATEEADEMTSASTGEPYADLPTAFAYKSRDLSQPGQCGCTPAPDTAARQSSPADAKAVLDIETKPASTPEPSSTQPAKAAVAERPYEPGSNKVRVVGPSFLPPQESAIDLKHPAGPGYQPQQQTN